MKMANRKSIYLISFLLILILGGCSSEKQNAYTTYSASYEMQDELTNAFYDNEAPHSNNRLRETDCNNHKKICIGGKIV